MASQINEITEEKRVRLYSQPLLSQQQSHSGCSEGDDGACGDERKGQGRWTKEEHKKFIDGIKMYGRNWKLVEEHIGSRTGAQIRSHAQKFFNRIEKEQQSTTTFSQASNQLLQIMQTPTKLTKSLSQTNKSSSQLQLSTEKLPQEKLPGLSKQSSTPKEREIEASGGHETSQQNPVQLQGNGSVRISLKLPQIQQQQQNHLASPLLQSVQQQKEVSAQEWQQILQRQQQQQQQQQLIAKQQQWQQQQQQQQHRQQQLQQRLSTPPGYPSEIIPGSSIYINERQHHQQQLFSEHMNPPQPKRYFLEPRHQSDQFIKNNKYIPADPRFLDSAALPRTYKGEQEFVEHIAYEYNPALAQSSNANNHLHLLNNSINTPQYILSQQQQHQHSHLYANPIASSNGQSHQFKAIYEKQQQQQQQLAEQQLLQQQQQQQQLLLQQQQNQNVLGQSSSSPLQNPISPYSQINQPAQNNNYEDSDEVVDKYLRQIQENSVQDNSYFIEHHLADITEPRLYEMCALGQADQSLNFKTEIYLPNPRGQHKGRSRFGSFKLHDEENELSNMKYQNLRKASVDDQELKKKLKLNDGGSSLSSSQFQQQAQQQQQQQQQQQPQQQQQQPAENNSTNSNKLSSPLNSTTL